MRAARREKLTHALTATSIGGSIGGGPIAGPILGSLAQWGISRLQASKAEQRRRFAGQLVDVDPALTAIRDRVRALPVRTRDQAEARAETVIAALSAPERTALVNAMAGTAHSAQLLRQLGRSLFAPEFAGGGQKWQGTTLPLGASSARLNPGRVLELLGLPTAAETPTRFPQDSGFTQPQGPSSFPVFDRVREALGTTPTTQESFGMPYFNDFLSSAGIGGGGTSGALGGLFGALGSIGSAAVTAALAPTPKVQVFAPGGSMLPQVLGGAVMGGLGGLLGSGFDVTPGFSIGPQGGDAITSPWRSTQGGAAAQQHIQVNPASGRLTWFGPIGRPVLFSGDFRACKRVARVARRARRRVGGR